MPPLDQYKILGLLPNYLERSASSLVNMVSFFMRNNHQKELFFLYDHDQLNLELNSGNQPKLLFGVSFALLDFAKNHQYLGDDLVIIETGGMKGRAEEITKSQVIRRLRKGFPNAKICSEYGMTELMSQAYAVDSEIYKCPSWMKILPRSISDPFSSQTQKSTSALKHHRLSQHSFLCVHSHR